MEHLFIFVFISLFAILIVKLLDRRLNLNLMEWLGEPICTKSECTRLGAIVLTITVILTFVIYFSKLNQ